MSRFDADDRELLRKSVRSWAADLDLVASARRALDGDEPDTRALWSRMARDLDTVGLTVPEVHGGTGTDLAEAAVVLEELAAVLAPLPYAGGLAVVAVLEAAGDAELNAELLPRIGSGETLVVPAIAEGVTVVDPGRLATTASESDGAWTLCGTKTAVAGGGVADQLLVAARTDDGLGFFLVATDATGLTRTPLKGFDASRPAVEVGFASTPARRITTADPAPAYAAWLRTTQTALAVEQLAGARACLAETVEFLKVRKQFGRPLGSFQALKHRCADMYAEIELAAAAAGHAVDACDGAEVGDSSRATADSGLAYALSSLAYRYVAGESIQLHGGMGFTWECDAHLHLRRSFATGSLYGPPDSVIERIAPDLSGADR